MFDLHAPEFWVFAAFMILVVIGARPGYRALGALLDERGQKIQRELEEAAALKAEAQALLDDFKRKHAEAVRTADDIVKHARDDAARIARQAQIDLEASMKRREQTALERVAQAERQAVAEVRGAAVDLAIAATQALVQAKASGNAGAAIIDQSIRDLPGRLN